MTYTKSKRDYNDVILIQLLFMRLFEQTFQVVSVWNHSVTINRNRLIQTNKKSLKYSLIRQQLRDWQIILRQMLYVGVYFSWEWADKKKFFVNVDITGLNIYFIHLILYYGIFHCYTTFSTQVIKSKKSHKRHNNGIEKTDIDKHISQILNLSRG